MQSRGTCSTRGAIWNFQYPTKGCLIGRLLWEKALDLYQIQWIVSLILATFSDGFFFPLFVTLILLCFFQVFISFIDFVRCIIMCNKYCWHNYM